MSLVTRAVVEFVLRHQPQILPQLLEGLHLLLGVEPERTRNLLCAAREKIPVTVLVEMLRRVRQGILADDTAPYRIGFEIVTLYQWDRLRGTLLRLFGSPQRAARLGLWLSHRFALMVADPEASEVSHQGCRRSFLFNPSVQLSHGICEAFRGGVAALPLSWGAEPVEVKEETCFFPGLGPLPFHRDLVALHLARSLVNLAAPAPHPAPALPGADIGGTRQLAGRTEL